MQQSSKDLIDHLRDQLTFLRGSGAAFDDGADAEAKRLAVATRVLVHDSRRGSRSLLRQLGLKSRLQMIDTMPGDPNGVPGLAMAEWDGDVWRWVAPLGRRSRRVPLGFRAWWEAVVIVDQAQNSFNRRDLVLALANKDGGAHVDPRLNDTYGALARLNSIGWHMRQESSAGPPQMQPAASPVPANVRQIAWELQMSIEEQLSDLL